MIDNLKIKWDNLNEDEKRKYKVLSIGGVVLLLICVLIIPILFSDNEEQQLTEIEIPNAQEVNEYNSKLEAISSNKGNQNSDYETDLNNFFAISEETEEINHYKDEAQKVDSLAKLFDEENKKYSYSKTTVKRSNTTYKKESKEDNIEKNKVEYVKTVEVLTPKVEEKSKEEIAEEKRIKRLNELRGNNNTSSNLNLNSIEALIRGNQVLKNGQTISITNLAEFNLNGILIPLNTYMYGQIQFDKNKAFISIKSINVKGQIIHCNLEVYSLKGSKGIDVNITEDLNEVKGDAVNQELQTNRGTFGRVGNVLSDVVRKKTSEQKIEFVDNQKILLLVK